MPETLTEEQQLTAVEARLAALDLSRLPAATAIFLSDSVPALSVDP